MQVSNGSTDVTTYFVLRDSTNHAPKTDVTVTDIDLYYCEQGAAMAAKVDATALAAADSAHGDNQGFHVGQGLYRIDWPDAAFDGGVGKVVNLVVVCTGVDTTFLEVELTGVPQTGDSYAVVSNVTHGNSALAVLIGAPSDLGSGASLAKNLVDIEGQTDDIGVAGAGLTNVPWNAAWDAEVESEVDDALVAFGLPTDDSIADQVWDELIAHHVAAGSTGAALSGVAAAVWGYTTRTLTSLSALVASVAAAVWAYATRTLTSTAAATTAAVTGSALTITRATTWSGTLTGLTISASWTKLYFTVKRRKRYTDAQATLQIVVSNPADAATDGVLYIEAGAASATQRTQASLTVDQAAGTVQIDLTDDLGLTERAGQVYDVKQMIAGSSSSYQVTESTVDVESPVTLTV